jgi:hypothetical protein
MTPEQATAHTAYHNTMNEPNFDPMRAAAASMDCEKHCTPDEPFDFWLTHHCYGCGGSTNAPRIEHENDSHAGDPSHRWCFE